MAARPVVLTIAGFDPSSGAGISADIKTIAAHHCYGVACITALTVQSTLGVRRVAPLTAGLVGESLEELAADCAGDGRYAFLYVAAPLKVARAAGTPVNPVVIK